jgi:hypothetical protein
LLGSHCVGAETRRTVAAFQSLRLNIDTNPRSNPTSILNYCVSFRLCRRQNGAPSRLLADTDARYRCSLSLGVEITLAGERCQSCSSSLFTIADDTDRTPLCVGTLGAATAFADNAGVIGLILSIQARVSCHAACL